MITTIRITNVEEAKTAVLMIQAYLSTFSDDKATAIEEKTAKKPTRKPRTTKKAPTKSEDEAEEVKETKEVSEPVKEEKAVKEAPESELTLADMTALTKEAVAGSNRDTVKDLIASYGKGKLSSVETDKFEALAAELRGLAA